MVFFVNIKDGKIVLGRFIDFATFTKFFFVNNLSNYTTSEYTMYIAIYSRVLHVYMGLLKHKFTITWALWLLH